MMMKDSIIFFGLLILAAYHGFDALYVVTINDRLKEKKEFFAPFKKIQVIGF